MEKLSRDEAEKKLRDWADVVELDTERELFKNIVEELRYPVQLKKIDFEEETETFKLVLSSKIEGRAIAEIKSCDFGAKRVLQKFKDNESIDQARAMIAAYTGMSEGEIKQLKDRDISRINAIILGFITQTDPKKG